MLVAVLAAFAGAVLWLSAVGLGLTLIYRGLRGGAIDRQPHCRQCGYLVVGLPAEIARCPECGSDLRVPGAIRLGRRHRRPAAIAAGGMIVVLAVAAVAAICVPGAPGAPGATPAGPTGGSPTVAQNASNKASWATPGGQSMRPLMWAFESPTSEDLRREPSEGQRNHRAASPWNVEGYGTTAPRGSSDGHEHAGASDVAPVGDAPDRIADVWSGEIHEISAGLAGIDTASIRPHPANTNHDARRRSRFSVARPGGDDPLPGGGGVVNDGQEWLAPSSAGSEREASRVPGWPRGAVKWAGEGDPMRAAMAGGFTARHEGRPAAAELLMQFPTTSSPAWDANWGHSLIIKGLSGPQWTPGYGDSGITGLYPTAGFMGRAGEVMKGSAGVGALKWGPVRGVNPSPGGRCRFSPMGR